ncbi:MAG: archaetidylserine decarboxylase [Candidatus Competibacteraceae bacterium]|nr:archaetidylserine decarboxylase [Candidatus Competibacteraceae bacterium]
MHNAPSTHSNQETGDQFTKKSADYLLNLPQYLLPQRLITRVTYRLARIETPWFKNGFIRIFSRIFNINMDEAQEPDYRAYRHFNAFFTRALRPAARPLDTDDKRLCCPVDGTVSQAGNIVDDQLFQAKGRSFALPDLLGGDADLARLFNDGTFATLYLSPCDYHRIHMPIRGVLREMVHIPGRLFSVSPLTTRVIPGLFARNERVVANFDTAIGPLVMILVGAINVASIETVWAGVITPPLGTEIRRWSYPASGTDAVILEKGAEMGRFNMGSTVIMLCGPDVVSWESEIHPGATIRMGQALATITVD